MWRVVTPLARVVVSSSRHLSSSAPALLKQLRSKTAGTAAVTTGLADNLLERFAGEPLLVQALTEANQQVDALVSQYGKAAVTEKSELALVADLQAGFVNFYDPGALMPCVYPSTCISACLSIVIRACLGVARLLMPCFPIFPLQTSPWVLEVLGSSPFMALLSMITVAMACSASATTRSS